MTMAAAPLRRCTLRRHMTSGVQDLQDRIAILERHMTASVESLHHIRARTSRVLAATNAFNRLRVEARSLAEVVRTLVSLARANRESVDRGYVE